MAGVTEIDHPLQSDIRWIILHGAPQTPPNFFREQATRQRQSGSLPPILFLPDSVVAGRQKMSFPRRVMSSESAAMLLPGGFNKRSLREWCKLNDFGDRVPVDARDMRRRRRLISSGPDDQYYVDMFESKIPQATKVSLRSN